MSSLLTLIKYYLNQFLVILDIGDLPVAALYVALVINNFQLSQMIYDQGVSVMFHQNEKLLHKCFKYLRDIFENTIYGFLNACKDIVLALLAGFIPKLPGPIKMGFDYCGITNYINNSLDRVNQFEKKQSMRREQKERLRNIEKNRPRGEDDKEDSPVRL